jgi:hypothetical protein
MASHIHGIWKLHMTLDKTLELLRVKEKKSGYLLRNVLSQIRHRRKSNINILEASHAFYLPAVNSRARIKWSTIFIQEIFRFFDIPDNEHGPPEPVFLVTIADKSHVTTDQPQQIQLSRIKRKIGPGLKGLSYIGMIEPGYYNLIYDEFGNRRKNVVSWHVHLLVWGISEKQLGKHLARIKSRYTPIMPGLCAVHKKRIPRDQFGYKLWYILKAPRKEYSIGKRRNTDAKTGAVKYKQNSRPLRPGNRIRLFYLMGDMYLDELAMGGGEGSELLRKIKYEALREYRIKNGWDDWRR